MAKGKRLKKLSDLRRFMANVILKVEKGEMESGLGSKLAYMINIHKGIIEGSDLEKRILKLEKSVEGKKYGH